MLRFSLRGNLDLLQKRFNKIVSRNTGTATSIKRATNLFPWYICSWCLNQQKLNGCHHRWVHLSVPTILRPQLRIPITTAVLFSIDMVEIVFVTGMLKELVGAKRGHHLPTFKDPPSKIFAVQTLWTKSKKKKPLRWFFQS